LRVFASLNAFLEHESIVRPQAAPAGRPQGPAAPVGTDAHVLTGARRV
jgi:hypothetical protein